MSMLAGQDAPLRDRVCKLPSAEPEIPAYVKVESVGTGMVSSLCIVVTVWFVPV